MDLRVIAVIPDEAPQLTLDKTLVSEQVGGSVAEWLACWTRARNGLGSNRSRDAVE